MAYGTADLLRNAAVVDVPASTTPDGQTTAKALVTAPAGTVTDSTGSLIDPDSMAQTLAYSGGNLSTITATDGTDSWVQTFTYTGSDLTGISKWVKQ